MKKQPLEMYGSTPADLIYWIKQYLNSKMLTLGLKKGFTGVFDRDLHGKMIIEAKNVEEIRHACRSAGKNGLSSPNVYSTPLIAFWEYVRADKSLKSLKDIDTDYRDNYIALNPKAQKPSTLNGALVQINSLFRYIDKNNIDKTTGKPYSFLLGRTADGDKTTNPVLPQTEPLTYLEPAELKHFLKAIAGYPYKVKNSSRPILMVKLVIFGGLGAEELALLTQRSASFVANPTPLLSGRFLCVTVPGKRAKERVVYIKAELLEKEYESHVADGENCKDALLFCNTEGDRFSSRTTYDTVRRLLEYANIHKGQYGLHVLRRSYAAYLFINNVEFAVVKDLLGQGDDSITDLYMQITKSGLRNIAKKWEDL